MLLPHARHRLSRHVSAKEGSLADRLATRSYKSRPFHVLFPSLRLLYVLTNFHRWLDTDILWLSRTSRLWLTTSQSELLYLGE